MKRIKKFLPSLLFCSIFVGIIISLYIPIILPVIFIVAFLIVLFEFLIYYFRRKGNVVINTPDGSNQPYHPSVLYFNNAWNGYRYWMAYTPFPINAKPYRDRWEYPCIAVSNDGKNWFAVNDNLPLDDLNYQQILDKDYFSDTHLVFNSKENRIECYYRLSEERYSNGKEKGVWLFRRYSYDGKNWSDRQVSIRPWDIVPQTNGLPCISPAIIIENGRYKMWYVANYGSDFCVCYSESEDGIKWQPRKKCELKGYFVNPWHIDCIKNGDEYLLLIYDFSQRLTLFKSTDQLSFSFVKIVLSASNEIGSFYKSSLYRSCLLVDDSCKLYFSGGNERKVCVGLMQGQNFENLKVISSSEDYSVKDFIIDWYEKYFLFERWLIWKICNMLHITKKTWF